MSSGRKAQPDLILLASPPRVAREWIRQHGLNAAKVLVPRSRADLAGIVGVPVYAHESLWSHPQADALASYFTARLAPSSGLPQHGQVHQDPLGLLLN